MPSHPPEKERQHARNQRGPTQEQKGYSTSEAVIALKDALIKENTANRERQPSDKKPGWIEISTLILVIVTTGLLVVQDVILHNSDVTFRETLEAQRLSSERQLRAYVGVIPPSDDQVVNAFLPPASPLVRLTPKNFGVTPAYGAELLSGMGVAPYPLPKTFTYPIQKIDTPPNPITIYPGTFDIAGIVADAARPLTQDEIASIQDGKNKRLYVWGAITYKDAFGKSHFTHFCIGFYNLTPTRVQREPCNDHNDSS
jgi:hypothetical protein